MIKKYFESYQTASIYKGGFFIFDSSPSLTKDELSEIERIGSYEVFDNNFGNLDEEMIKEVYPICIAYYSLKSFPNRKILIRSNYTGATNHTPDRPGNFFTHAVIFESNKLDFSFKQFFEHFKWKKILTIEEDKSYKPNLNKGEYTYEDNIQNKEVEFKYFSDFLDYSVRIQLFIKVELV